ncbi:hypothetical protein [Mesorhizobium sp. M8A.F.Ca.ET.165.01.1.1]|uniref:hypothetical protein n=1 Tax=Mesorhizobium sp. M8A.F.Ca.ET.165.01.1.1 TaxID=2563960 RepID=UPI0010934DD9|nr:hypothetical protein [Mesorhizobium sp. M8A.F.Ca.ET.165.01.1.1]TGT35682.1 hypothetical protein EN808_31860 [Mesorhizobium sp. M8A.F.Ca.ET.165.01.1.1]
MEPSEPVDTIDWVEIRANRYAKAAPPPEWPAGIKVTSLEGLTLLGMHPVTNQLYWDGQELATVKRLGTFERGMALAATVATVLVAVVEILRAFGIAH